MSDERLAFLREHGGADAAVHELLDEVERLGLKERIASHPVVDDLRKEALDNLAALRADKERLGAYEAWLRDVNIPEADMQLLNEHLEAIGSDAARAAEGE